MDHQSDEGQSGPVFKAESVTLPSPTTSKISLLISGWSVDTPGQWTRGGGYGGPNLCGQNWWSELMVKWWSKLVVQIGGLNWLFELAVRIGGLNWWSNWCCR